MQNAPPCRFIGASIDTVIPKKRPVAIAIGSAAVIGGVLIALAVIGYIKYRQISAAMSAPPRPEMPVAVSLAMVQPTTLRQTSVVVGSVVASQSITLQNELSGVVTKVEFTPGGKVAANDVLVRLDVRSEQAELKSAQATSQLNKSALERLQRLSANTVSEQDLDIAAAELTRSQAEADRLQVMIEKKTIRAPFNAQAGLFDLHEGQYLDAGAKITMLEGIADFIFVDFAVPAHIADQIKLGEMVEASVDDSSENLAAKIIAIDSRANAISRSITARARLDHPPQTLQPNDSLRVTITYGPQLPAFDIPATAVRRSPAGTIVYVTEETENGMRASTREVVVGGGDGKLVRVLKGLQSGDQIIADGSFKITEGTAVKGSNDEVDN